MNQLESKDLASSLPVLPRLDRLDFLVTIFSFTFIYLLSILKNNVTLFVHYAKKIVSQISLLEKMILISC